MMAPRELNLQIKSPTQMEAAVQSAVTFLLNLESRSSEMAYFHHLVDQINTALHSGTIAVPLGAHAVTAMVAPVPGQETNALAANRVRAALAALLADPDGAIPALISALDEPSSRYFASTLLGWFGPAAAAAIPSLLYEVADGSAAADAARQAIARIGHAEGELFEVLRESLKAGDDFQFLQLCDLAMLAGYHSSPEYAKLLQAGAESANAELRAHAARAVGSLPAAERQLLRTTLQRLRVDSAQIVRDAAVEALSADDPP